MTKRQQYQICKLRGHTSNGVVLTVSPLLFICRHCGTHYRSKTVLEEYNIPPDDE